MNYRRPLMSIGSATKDSTNITPNPKKLKSKHLPSSTIKDESLIEFFTNNHFSRSFNSLILEDVDPEKEQPKKLNKSPPFNVKQDYYTNDKIDDYLSGNEDDILNDGPIPHELSRSSNTYNGSIYEDNDDYSVNSTYQKARPRLETSIKRSSKFLNLSIDSNVNKRDFDSLDIDRRSSAENTPFKKHDHLAFELNNSTPKRFSSNESTPALHNKFKRPHQLISKSPSPHLKVKSSNTSLSTKSSATKSNKVSPILTNFKNNSLNKLFNFKQSSTKLRKTENPSPIKFEYYNIEDLMIDDSDLPSKNRKSSNSSNHSHIPSNIQIYHDTNSAQPIHQLPPPSHDKRIFNDKENEEKPSYQFVKPLQTAFKSTGLMKKSSLCNQTNKLPPETPIKKHHIMLFNDKPNFYDNENTSEISIEVGRNAHNQSYSQSNDSTISLFKIQDEIQTSSKKPTALELNDGNNMIDDSCLETPTKSVKKSHSTPSNFSPLSTRHAPTTPTVKKSSSYIPHHGYEEGETDENTEQLNVEASHFKSQYVDKSTVDEHLNKKFGNQNIRYLSKGEFSIAFECNFDNQKFAIKRSKKPIIGKLEVKNIMREINALRTLTSVKDNESINLKEQEEGKEYLVYFIEAWEFNSYYYIMTEFCEGGTLFNFLQDNTNYKVDEFRVWKILIEILNGLKFIHLKNYLHLDLKPANIFITFEGSLKIGDFGLATKLPILEKDFDLEGDRNYIAPELINDKIYTPFADIFSVGLIILEIATNIVLPDNGTPWRKLRSGDLSDAGKLSSDNISDFLQHRNFSSLTSYNSLGFSLNSIHLQPPHNPNTVPAQQLASDEHTLDQIKDLLPPNAPKFLLSNSNNLDRLVNKMLQPNPFDRLTATKILEMEECVTIDNIRKAGATIYEGEFGPINDDDE